MVYFPGDYIQWTGNSIGMFGPQYGEIFRVTIVGKNHIGFSLGNEERILNRLKEHQPGDNSYRKFYDGTATNYPYKVSNFKKVEESKEGLDSSESGWGI